MRRFLQEAALYSHGRRLKYTNRTFIVIPAQGASSEAIGVAGFPVARNDNERGHFDQAETAMHPTLRTIGEWLRRRAENVLATLMAVMFLAFIAQIVFRYLMKFPIGWTSELTVITWLWLVLWGAAFVVTEAEEIRFDLIYGSVGTRVRRVIAVMTAVALLALYSMSLPAVVDYVTFMKVQSTAYLKIRFDLLFSIYVIFAVAILIRYAWILWRALRGSAPEEFDPTKASSGV
jgi:C4-dicarboxylate transporter DctQ subunit